MKCCFFKAAVLSLTYQYQKQHRIRFFWDNIAELSRLSVFRILNGDFCWCITRRSFRLKKHSINKMIRNMNLKLVLIFSSASIALIKLICILVLWFSRFSKIVLQYWLYFHMSLLYSTIVFPKFEHGQIVIYIQNVFIMLWVWWLFDII